MNLAGSGLAALAVLLALVLGAAGPAAAQFDTQLVVTVSDDPDPAASGGQVNYTVRVKADGPTKAKNVVVTMPMPAETVFVKCNMVLAVDAATSTPCTPGLANGTVTVNLGNIRAHLEARLTLTLTMPTVTAVTPVTLDADADSTTVTDDHNHATTSVLPPGSFVTYLPSGRVGPIACGDTLTPEAFDSDTTAKLSGDLGCTSGAFGLKITAAGTTLDLNTKKIFWSESATLGTVGVLVSDAPNVTIVGGSTNGTSGIEKFDWCVKDAGASKKLTISTLRCFRARTAGFDISSQKSNVLNSLVDRATGTATTTAEPPGGVGIRTRGDNMHIANTIVRRSATVGIWVAGLDTDGSGRVALIDGNTSTMRIEKSAGGIGLLLDSGPHSVKDVYVQADPPGAGQDGVVIGPTGVDNILDGVVVKDFGGNGFVVNGTGTELSRSNVENIGLDGYVVAGSGSLLSGNGVQQARHGYVVTGPDTVLESNGAEDLTGDGFVLNGDNADAAGNSAKINAGRGFFIGGNAGLFDTNTAEDNTGDGFVITGNGNTVKASRSKKSGATGITVSGSGNSFNTNAAAQNTGNEWVIGPNNIDDGGNKNNGSTFLFDAAGGTFN